MRYEPFLFTRNERQDFMAFIRPARMTNKDVSAIGAVFNYMGDVSRLTPRFPGLYCFRLGAYILLLRHYNSGRTHAGRAIAVIEGIAIEQTDSAEVAQCVAEQRSLLNVMSTVQDIEQQGSQIAEVQEWHGLPMHHPEGAFVEAFLRRREEDRLFLPFSDSGLDMLMIALADGRFTSPPFFAFGTNSDVLTQLERRGATIDIASFLNTDRPCFRNRATNRLSGSVAGYEDDEEVEDEPPADPSMSLRADPSDPYLLPSGGKPLLTTPAESEKPTAADDAVSIRSGMNVKRPPDKSGAPSDTRVGDKARPIRSRMSQPNRLQALEIQ